MKEYNIYKLKLLTKLITDINEVSTAALTLIIIDMVIMVTMINNVVYQT